MPSMTQYNNQLKINKVHTSTQRGYKLGSTNATWKKLKQVANVASDESFPVVDDDEQEEPIIQQGPAGEVFIIYPVSTIVEVWYWIPPEVEGDVVAQDFSGDTLYFYSQIKLTHNPKNVNSNINNSEESSLKPVIDSLSIIDGSLSKGYNILVVYKYPKFSIQTRTLSVSESSSSIIQHLNLPDFFVNNPGTELVVKCNSNFVVVSNNEGFLYVFNWDPVLSRYVRANSNQSLKDLKKSTTLPILRSFNLVSQVSDDEVLFKTSCSDKKAIFDLNNNWLVYSPTKVEYNQIKINQNSFTPVKLPTSKPLLNKVLENLSNTALDSLFRLSKFSTKKLNEYMKNRNNQDVSMKAVGNPLAKLLNQTLHSLNETKASFQINDNQIIKIVDLSNDKTLTIFKTPDGISNLSFNPYDLQLVNSNLRGDSFFIWDLLKLPGEVSLMGKFSRGKTSGIIDDFFWFINNNEDDPQLSDEILKGTNSGFGCINSKSGTVHWYNINYLLSNLSNNLPNYLGKEFPINLETSNKEFLNDWILSSSSGKYKQFLKVPNLLNLSPKNLCDLNQLAILDSENNLKLVNPLNGDNCFKFELPTSMVDSKLANRSKIIFNDHLKKKDNLIPLSQIEIETCKPFMNLTNYRNIEISCYDYPAEDTEGRTDFDNIYESYSTMTNHKVPIKRIKIENTKEMDEEIDFIDQLVDDLILND
ncbi:hypothetical protein PSN45_001965 [Yamadazyma tenuis]|uniref:Uncharacterized protein n=1 Tax=Candida tenuis (strain ATCC 10573 / BCRC 21748 / CBS 615 / JCM 9827 / NBRC 10315 / NRRL Y-1498 / VKM Y-70) TaxID=590646 RepID=G3BD98_CANTC|nr:uncharacterized protein CANTEDRAFT_127364 [Yamadazyma tenuis ATCC 10573]EGV60276.1 hypothetical protein CANTEDRAFT_127364 [Yamadazyma tenuis ATCC 10573]WEJ94481.1 hypothetical protein PSN45_001965 [Yamadazyma tenuis]